MKKRLLTLSLVAGISVIALSACSDGKPLTKKDGVVLTIGSGANAIEYTTEDLFNQFKTTNSTGISAYYNAISEVLVRNAMRDEAQSQGVKSIVASQIDNTKQKAKDNASMNGTSYKTELDSLLKSEGVENLKELEDKYTYEEIKKRLQDKYYDENTDVLLEDYIDTVSPYHIRHILINVSSTSGTAESYSRGTITEQEARNLAAVVRRLSSKTKTGDNKLLNETFGTIAYEMSEDTNSAITYGDLGIMSTATGYVNEFKLGLYSYDTIFNPTGTNNKNKVRLVDDAETIIVNHGIREIPYSETQLFEDYADVTTDKDNKLVNDGDAAFYPRNIYFNQYFNDHGLSVIVNDTGIANSRFKVVKDKNGLDMFGGKTVLHDERGNLILVTRAGSGYEGIHFIIAEKSALRETPEVMAAYFDQTLPGQRNKDNVTINVGETFVGFIKSTTNVYKDRAAKVKEAVKGFDPMIDARLFEEYSKSEYKVTINPDLYAQIQNYIAVSREYYTNEAKTTLEYAWEAYAGTLSIQKWASDRKIDVVCASGFTNGFKEGDACYEKK